MQYRKARPEDLPHIIKLLNNSNLPSDDCDEQIENFIVIIHDDRLIASGCLQPCGQYGLLRSIAVEPEHRGKGIAQIVFQRLNYLAIEAGIRQLYLLTETATEYFRQRGFIEHQRADAPAAITQTRQFKQLCPDSAILMSLILNSNTNE